MSDLTIMKLSLGEFCRVAALPRNIVIAMVDADIVTPTGEGQHNWLFNIDSVDLANRAERLHHDLDIDWPGISLAMSLLDELDQLRENNKQLRNQLRQ
jgi:chaperone modulatory protein CbpM